MMMNSRRGTLPELFAVICLGWLGLLAALPVAAQEAETEASPLAAVFPDGRHLVSLSYSRIDAFDTDIDLLVGSYSYAYDRRFRFTIAAPYVSVSDLVLDPALPEQTSSFSGLGDVSVLVQYDPSANLSANAFVPDTLGLTFGLQMPTGEFREGLGQDTWVASIGGGWLVDFFKDSWLIPAVTYAQSFEEGEANIEVQRMDITLGAYWLFRNAIWLGFVPNVGYDWVEDDTRIDLSASAGKAWLNGVALELIWGRLDRIDALAKRDDRQLFLGLSYQFGSPPR